MITSPSAPVQAQYLFIEKWNPGVISQVNYIDQVLYDFTEGQGYDGQIISSQAKYRNTNQYTTDTCTDNSYQQCQKETHRRNRNRIHDTFGKYRTGKRAHTHESRMAKA